MNNKLYLKIINFLEKIKSHIIQILLKEANYEKNIKINLIRIKVP